MGIFKSIRGYVDALVHPSALNDALALARHRAFIGPRLIGASIALAAFPAYLVMRGVPSVLEIIVFSWLTAPILISYFLSRTGQYERAHVLSSFALTGLATIVALKTGGIASFAAIWLVIVPLEAALSASRRVVAVASLLALCAAGLLVLCDIFQWLPAPAPEEQRQGALAALGIISASLYATGLALGAESLARTSFWLRCAEEDRYRLLARNMTDVITRHDANGSVLFISPAAESLLGTPITELMGHGLFDHVHVADRPAYLTALSDALKNGDAQSVEFRLRSDIQGVEGENLVRFIWLEMRCRPLDHAAAGQPDDESKEIVAVMRDITDRKSQEQALVDARAEAERANTAKGRFLATMSHELRTPLNVIIGFSQMLQREKDMQIDSARRTDYASLIHDSGQHLLSVVNGILDMSRLETGEFEIRPESFALAPVVATCCALFELKAGDAGITITPELAADLPDINADRRALKQILINLLSNAIKFTNRGGNIKVSAYAEVDAVLISVEDNGIGVSAEDLPRLGNPFFQARGSYDRPHDGTGLGLSIVRGLVALHGGELSMRSKLGEGTCITIRLPVDCDASRRARAKSVVHHVAPPASRHENTISAKTLDRNAAVRISA
ncbi:MAG: PAS domain-containing sensor histidine kinase [Xanthobacteraceae bacterium]